MSDTQLYIKINATKLNKENKYLIKISNQCHLKQKSLKQNNNLFSNTYLKKMHNQLIHLTNS